MAILRVGCINVCGLRSAWKQGHLPYDLRSIDINVVATSIAGMQANLRRLRGICMSKSAWIGGLVGNVVSERFGSGATDDPARPGREIGSAPRKQQ